jgi:hypothetical protein
MLRRRMFKVKGNCSKVRREHVPYWCLALIVYHNRYPKASRHYPIAIPASRVIECGLMLSGLTMSNVF